MNTSENKDKKIDRRNEKVKTASRGKTLVLLSIGLLLILFSPVPAAAAEVFTTPANLQDNVDFWKKIYTEVSLQQGFIHDRDYPMIIYKTITIGKMRGRKRSRYIRGHMNGIKIRLANITKKTPGQWTKEEQAIATLFTRYASLEEVKTARKRLRFQQGQKERFKEGLERSGAYLPYILSTFIKYKIPPRIAYLPHVESSFNSRAYSRVGAAGMWQFMRRTGRLYLKVNYRVDERFDPIKSTEAAAKLLRYNYGQLKSWPLAITAYNHGLASMKRAVRVTNSRDLGVIIEKYKNRRFRFASKNFYGCFLAASEIASNPYKYFPQLKYHSPPKYHEIQLRNYFRPRTLTKYLGVSQDQIKVLNPSLRSIIFRRQLPVPKGFKLRLPISISLEDARAKLGTVPRTLKKVKATGDRYYSVRRGDTLYRISRRFRVSSDALIIANEIDREDRIYVGQVLRIPGKNGSSKAVVKAPAPTPAAPTPAPKAKTVKTESKPVPQEKQAPPASSSIETRAAVNSTPAKPPAKGTAFIFDATLYNLDVKKLRGKSEAVIRVAVDETLGHIADWLGTSVRHLRRHNRGRRSIRVNQKIYIPLKHAFTLEQFNAKRLEYHMAQEEDFYSSYRVVDSKERTVEYGDTLWSICNRDEEIPIWLLKKYNRNINLDTLKVNMLLTIPVIAASD
jgi:membrane-bound lytic murein transglycosylase D